MARVLVVDDAAFMRKMVSDALTKGGHEVVGEGANGEEAVTLYQELKPELTTLDITMPGIGMFALRGYMARNSIASIIVMLTVIGTILSLPNIGMYYGLHEWTAARTGGVVDARVITLFNTALESPLGQIAMIPMLAWIAASATVTVSSTPMPPLRTVIRAAPTASTPGIARTRSMICE